MLYRRGFLRELSGFLSFVEEVVRSNKLRFQALIRFRSYRSAIFAKNSLHVRNIYEGFCRLVIKFCDYYGNTECKLLAQPPPNLQQRLSLQLQQKSQPLPQVAQPWVQSSETLILEKKNSSG